MPPLGSKGQPSTKATKPRTAKADKGGERPILYPEVTIVKYKGDKAMSITKAKDLIGWQEVTDEDKKNKGLPEPLFKDKTGARVRLLRNAKNRPFNIAWAETVAQERLNGRWQFNGETIIVSTYGDVISGQHRLVGFLLAEQIRTGKRQKEYWADTHPDPLTLETIVVYGIDDSPEVLRTLDNVRPRTLADVLYTNPEVFGSKTTENDRRKIARIIDYTVKCLWARTGANENPYAPRRTHSEALDFINHHPRVLRAAKHIYEENGEARISGYLSLGEAAGALYLMGACKTDETSYRNQETPSEKNIDFDTWEQACEFWSQLADQDNQKFKELRFALGNLQDPKTGARGTASWAHTVLCKAWVLFLKGEPFTPDNLALNIQRDKNDAPVLGDNLDLGGIDRGVKRRQPERQEKVDEEAANAIAKDKKKGKKSKKAKAGDKKSKKTKDAPTAAPVPNGATTDEERAARRKQVDELLKRRANAAQTPAENGGPPPATVASSMTGMENGRDPWTDTPSPEEAPQE